MGINGLWVMKFQGPEVEDLMCRKELIHGVKVVGIGEQVCEGQAYRRVSDEGSGWGRDRCYGLDIEPFSEHLVPRWWYLFGN